MSKMGIVATLALIVLLAVGAWWYVSNTSVPAQEAPMVAETPEPTPEPDKAGISSDTSDAGLDQDMKTVDAHIDAAAEAGASANTFTDTPIEQSE